MQKMTRIIGSIEIDDQTFIAHSRTDAAYLQEVMRFWQWVQQRYTAPTLEDAFTLATLDRYWHWCTPQLRPAAIQRRKVAIQWFVDVALKRSESSEGS